MATKLCTRLIKIFSIVIFLLSPLNFLFSNNSMESYEISLTQAFELYKENKLLIVDIRTEKEWQSTGIIPNSKLLSMHDNQYNEIENFPQQIKSLIDKNEDTNISFICASGARSEIVAKFFLDKGYNNISHIPDGITGKSYNGWLYEGFPIEPYKLD